jgi:hypothetical protein
VIDAGAIRHAIEKRRPAPVIAEHRARETQERRVDVVRRHRSCDPVDIGGRHAKPFVPAPDAPASGDASRPVRMNFKAIF